MPAAATKKPVVDMTTKVGGRIVTPALPVVKPLTTLYNCTLKTIFLLNPLKAFKLANGHSIAWDF